MKAHSLVVLVGLAGVGACASTEIIEPRDNDPSPAVIQPMDAGFEAAADGEAGTCAVDCEYFPETCSADALCPNGPFQPDTRGGSLDPRMQVNVIRGRSATDVWVGGALGGVAHFDGVAWKRSHTGTSEAILALWLLDASEVALGSITRVYARGVDVDAGTPPSAGEWTSIATITYGPSAPYFMSGWAAPGATWFWCAMSSAESQHASGLVRLRRAASSDFQIVAVVPSTGDGFAGWRQMTSVDGSSASDVWAVGAEGSAVHITDADSDAPAIKVLNSQTWSSLNGVWAASPSDVWSVGARGTIRHYTGDPVLWDIVPDVPTTVDLNAVWGASPTDVWAVGDDSVVIHYDGTTWTRVKVAGLGGRRPNLTAIWGSGPGHVWVGGQGVLLSLGGMP